MDVRFKNTLNTTESSTHKKTLNNCDPKIIAVMLAKSKLQLCQKTESWTSVAEMLAETLTIG